MLLRRKFLTRLCLFFAASIAIRSCFSDEREIGSDFQLLQQEPELARTAISTPTCTPLPHETVRPRRLVVVFARERTGSTLLTNLLKRDNMIRPDELWNSHTRSVFPLARMAKTMEPACLHNNNNNTMDSATWHGLHSRAIHQTKQEKPYNGEVYRRFLSSTRPYLAKIIDGFEDRFQNPETILKLLRDTPGDGFVQIKVFDSHLRNLGMSVDEMWSLLSEVFGARVYAIVLGRRNGLDSYLSLERARKNGKFHSKNNVKEAIPIDVDKFQRYIAEGKTYYADLRRSVEKAFWLDFSLDLATPELQMRTQQRLMKFLSDDRIIPPATRSGPPIRPLHNEYREISHIDYSLY